MCAELSSAAQERLGPTSVLNLLQKCGPLRTALGYGQRSCLLAPRMSTDLLDYKLWVAFTSAAYTPAEGTLVPAPVLVRVYEYAPVVASTGPLSAPAQRMTRTAEGPLPVTETTVPLMLT